MNALEVEQGLLRVADKVVRMSEAMNHIHKRIQSAAQCITTLSLQQTDLNKRLVDINKRLIKLETKETNDG